MIRDIIDDCPYVTVDVQQLGVHSGMVHQPLCSELLSKSPAEYNYASTKANVDVVKVIQIGLTFSHEHGRQPMIEPDDRRRRPCALMSTVELLVTTVDLNMDLY
jgi:CCR4-NOT transcription complex subunit 7/8